MAGQGGSRGSSYTPYDGSDLANSEQPEAGGVLAGSWSEAAPHFIIIISIIISKQ